MEIALKLAVSRICRKTMLVEAGEGRLPKLRNREGERRKKNSHRAAHGMNALAQIQIGRAHV